MAKKSFDDAKTSRFYEMMDEVTAEEQKEPTAKKSGRRRADLVRNENGGNSVQQGLPIEYTRFTCICKVNNVNDVRDYAYTKRITVKEAVDEIIEKFFQDYRSNPKNEKLLDHTRGKA